LHFIYFVNYGVVVNTLHLEERENRFFVP